MVEAAGVFVVGVVQVVQRVAVGAAAGAEGVQVVVAPAEQDADRLVQVAERQVLGSQDAPTASRPQRDLELLNADGRWFWGERVEQADGVAMVGGAEDACWIGAGGQVVPVEEGVPGVGGSAAV